MGGPIKTKCFDTFLSKFYVKINITTNLIRVVLMMVNKTMMMVVRILKFDMTKHFMRVDHDGEEEDKTMVMMMMMMAMTTMMMMKMAMMAMMMMMMANTE